MSGKHVCNMCPPSHRIFNNTYLGSAAAVSSHLDGPTGLDIAVSVCQATVPVCSPSSGRALRQRLHLDVFDNTDEDLVSVVDETARILLEADAAGQTSLVHCQFGRSRSATTLAMSLMVLSGLSSEQALTFLQFRRPCVGINAGFRFQLRLLEALLAHARGSPTPHRCLPYPFQRESVDPPSIPAVYRLFAASSLRHKGGREAAGWEEYIPATYSPRRRGRHEVDDGDDDAEVERRRREAAAAAWAWGSPNVATPVFSPAGAVRRHTSPPASPPSTPMALTLAGSGAATGASSASSPPSSAALSSGPASSAGASGGAKEGFAASAGASVGASASAGPVETPPPHPTHGAFVCPRVNLAAMTLFIPGIPPPAAAAVAAGAAGRAGGAGAAAAAGDRCSPAAARLPASVACAADAEDVEKLVASAIDAVAAATVQACRRRSVAAASAAEADAAGAHFSAVDGLAAGVRSLTVRDSAVAAAPDAGSSARSGATAASVALPHVAHLIAPAPWQRWGRAAPLPVHAHHHLPADAAVSVAEAGPVACVAGAASGASVVAAASAADVGGGVSDGSPSGSDSEGDSDSDGESSDGEGGAAMVATLDGTPAPADVAAAAASLRSGHPSSGLAASSAVSSSISRHVDAGGRADEERDDDGSSSSHHHHHHHHHLLQLPRWALGPQGQMYAGGAGTVPVHNRTRFTTAAAVAVASSSLASLPSAAHDGTSGATTVDPTSPAAGHAALSAGTAAPAAASPATGPPSLPPISLPRSSSMEAASASSTPATGHVFAAAGSGGVTLWHSRVAAAVASGATGAASGSDATGRRLAIDPLATPTSASVHSAVASARAGSCSQRVACWCGDEFCDVDGGCYEAATVPLPPLTASALTTASVASSVSTLTATASVAACSSAVTASGVASASSSAVWTTPTGACAMTTGPGCVSSSATATLACVLATDGSDAAPPSHGVAPAAASCPAGADLEASNSGDDGSPCDLLCPPPYAVPPPLPDRKWFCCGKCGSVLASDKNVIFSHRPSGGGPGGGVTLVPYVPGADGAPSAAAGGGGIRIVMPRPRGGAAAGGSASATSAPGAAAPQPPTPPPAYLDCGGVFIEPMAWMMSDGEEVMSAASAPGGAHWHASDGRDGPAAAYARALHMRHGGGVAGESPVGVSGSTASTPMPGSSMWIHPSTTPTVRMHMPLDALNAAADRAKHVLLASSRARSTAASVPAGGGATAGSGTAAHASTAGRRYYAVVAPPYALLLSLRSTEGKLMCPGPGCGARVGAYTWSGMICPCGIMMSMPCFYLAGKKIVVRPAPTSTSS